MDELEYRRLLKALPRAIEPERDLWAGIATRLDARAVIATKRPHLLFPFAAAAGFVAIAMTAGWLALQTLPGDRDAPMQAAAPPILDEARALRVEFDAALESGTGKRFAALREQADPRFLAAWTELDAAETELNSALETDPDARFILNRLKQVQHKRLQLTQKALSA